MQTSTEKLTTPSNTPLPTPIVEAGYPLVGMLPAILHDAPGTLLAAAARHRGEIFSLRLGPVEVPVVSEPAHLQEVLIDNARDFIKAGMWDAARPLLGNGLATSDGDFWRRQRRLLQPLFNRGHLNSLSEIMVSAIDAQLTLLAKRARTGASIDVGTEMSLITQRVLMETIFGASVSPEEAEHLGKHLSAGFGALNYRMFLYFLPAWIPRPNSRSFFSSIAVLDTALMRLVAERRAQPTEGVDLLNQLLAATDADTGEQMSDRQIRDELMTLFSAGLDTTALTLTWLTWILETHPGVETRLRAEVASVVGDRAPTLADLTKLVYTQQVIQETMRLYPAGWIFPRYTEEGSVVGGRRIAPKSSLLVSPFLTHRNPEYWPKPEVFDPDRFTPERSEGRPKLAFVPFGAGSRQCIGSHFSIMEAQFAVVMLLQRFRPRLIPGQRIEPAAAGTLRPRFGIKMKFNPA